jgi:AraC-like DNA-binding protein
VPRAGHLVGGPDHHIKRDHFPGHELILCRRGRGWVRIAGRTHAVAPGQLAWINCHHPHEHGALATDPWEVYWVRAEGLRLARMAEVLGVADHPVFVGFDSQAAAPLFVEVFHLMNDPGHAAPALISAAIARLVGLAFACRQESAPAQPAVPATLRPAVEHLRLFYFQPQRAQALARMCGMSASHFSRSFRAAFGTSPIDWLRRERINQAKRRLAGTDDAIKRIAEQVGYRDRFFFSKDFKRATGLTPRGFRRREATVTLES